MTERLLLRAWSDEDVEPLVEIYRQPEYLETMPPTDAAQQVEFWRRRWNEDGFAHWAACERQTGRLIGRIGLLRHHDRPLVSEPVEVGWVLHRAVWGQGLATEGGSAAVEMWRRHLPREPTLYSFRSRATSARAP